MTNSENKYYPLVSIIIPVYNVEQYLAQCLDSIINQTITNIEIICINDGSTDHSANILKSYKERDHRIKILTIDNQGAGIARNVGMNIATGKYIIFLDSDDFFEPDFIKKLYEKSEKDNLDIAVCRCNGYDNLTDQYTTINYSIKDELLPKKEFFNYKDIKNAFFDSFVWWPWDKLYRRSFIEKTELKFQSLRTTNDLYFVCMSMILANKIGTIKDILIHHRINNLNSISNTRELSWNNYLYALKALKEELKKHGIYANLKIAFINYVWNFSLWHLDTLSGDAFIELYKLLRKSIIYIYQVDWLDKQSLFYTEKMKNRYHEIIENDVTHYLLKKLKDLRKNQTSLKKPEKICQFSIGCYLRTKILSKLAIGQTRKKLTTQYQKQKKLYRLIKQKK